MCISGFIRRTKHISFNAFWIYLLCHGHILYSKVSSFRHGAATNQTTKILYRKLWYQCDNYDIQYQDFKYTDRSDNKSGHLVLNYINYTDEYRKVVKIIVTY